MSKLVVHCVIRMIERGEYADVILYFKTINQAVGSQFLILEVRVQSQVHAIWENRIEAENLSSNLGYPLLNSHVLTYLSCVDIITSVCSCALLTAMAKAILIGNRLLHALKGMVGSEGHN